jgi:hypothetical protein
LVDKFPYICNYIAKTPLTARPTYKTWIAYFLLSVYVIIATPSQVWHHHTYSSSDSISHSKEEKTVSKSDANTVDANCQICSHHFSEYADDTPTVFVVAVPIEVANEDFSLQSIPSAPFFNYTGRGPPTA